MRLNIFVVCGLSLLICQQVYSIEPISIGVGLGFGLYAGYEYIKSQFSETCTEVWIKPSISRLNESLKSSLHGQHLVNEVVLKAVRTHFKTKSPKKPLVLSFHGWTGGGKNFVSKLIADSIYVEGSKSQFVHWFVSTVHFPHEQKVAEYRDNLQQWIKGNVSLCPLSLFIFDEIDKMPSGVMDGVKPFLDYYDNIDGVNYKRSIFIFLSNTGGGDITKKMLEFWSEGIAREDIKYMDFEDVIMRGAFNEKGGLFQTSVIDKNLIDYYIPFLPLERKHVKLCIEDELGERGVNGSKANEMVEKIADEMQYAPKDLQLFSKTGCKRVAQKVDYILD